jgi:hypothetical protein
MLPTFRLKASDMTEKVKVAVIGGIALVVAAAVPLLLRHFGSPSEDAANTKPTIVAPVNATIRVRVKDAKCNSPVVAEASLQSVQGAVYGSPQKTDDKGEATFQAPQSASELLIVASAPGYADFRRKVNATDSVYDVALDPLPMNRGIPEGATLASMRPSMESDLNVAISFAPSCSARARNAALSAASLDGLRCAPQQYIEGLLARVKGRPAIYSVTEVVRGQRYEINCH